MPWNWLLEQRMQQHWLMGAGAPVSCTSQVLALGQRGLCQGCSRDVTGQRWGGNGGGDRPQPLCHNLTSISGLGGPNSGYCWPRGPASAVTDLGRPIGLAGAYLRTGGNIPLLCAELLPPPAGLRMQPCCASLAMPELVRIGLQVKPMNPSKHTGHILQLKIID